MGGVKGISKQYTFPFVVFPPDGYLLMLVAWLVDRSTVPHGETI